MSKESYHGALLRLLAAVKGIQIILGEQTLKRGYCITRPPGHHSKCGEAAGFCIFNNAAIAAKIAR